jgi:hypothetical protein
MARVAGMVAMFQELWIRRYFNPGERELNSEGLSVSPFGSM